MEHKGTITIETDRLVLRKLTIDDSLAVFNNWTSDNKVTEFLTWKTHESVDETQEILTKWVNNYNNLNYYQWAIVLKSIDEPIGNISVVSQNEQLDMIHVGYCVGSK